MSAAMDTALEELKAKHAEYCEEINEQIPFELFTDQWEYEEAMHEQGKARAMKAMEKDREGGTESDTKYGNALIERFSPRLGSMLQSLHSAAEANGGIARGRASNITGLMQFLGTFPDYNLIAAIALRQSFQQVTGRKPQPATSAAAAIGRAVVHEFQYSEIKAQDKKLAEAIRLVTKNKIGQAKKGEAFSYMKRKNPQVQVANLDEAYILEIGMTMVHLVCTVTQNHLRMVDMLSSEKGKTTTKKYLVASESLIKWIEDAKIDLLSVAAVYKPMLIKPRPWKLRESNYKEVVRDEDGKVVRDADGKKQFFNPLRMSGGYISSFVKPQKFCKSRNKAHHAAIDGGKYPELLTGINAAQDTAWRVRGRMLKLQTELYYRDLDWSHELGIAPSNPAAEPERNPLVETCEETRKKYRKAKAAWYQENIQRNGLRANFKLMLDTATELKDAPKFHVIWQLDSRGRGYPLGTLHCQGADPMKALVEFAEGKPVDSESVYWLKLQAANVIADCPWTGVNIDKRELDERVAWVDEHLTRLIAMCKDPLADTGWTNFDKPFQGLAAVWELEGYMEHGDGYISHIPVALDGSCSGLQILGTGFKCAQTAEVVNLVPNDKPSDIYSIVAKMVVNDLEDMVGELTLEQVKDKALEEAKEVYRKEGGEKVAHMLNELAGDNRELDKTTRKALNAYWKWLEAYNLLQYGVGRSMCKRSVMTFAYSSKEFGFKAQVMEDTMYPLLAKCEKSGAKFPFHQRGQHAAALMAKLIYKNVCATVVKAGEAMQWMSQCAKVIASEGRPVTWTTPLGFPVVQDYRKAADSVVELVIAGRRYQMTLTKETGVVDKNKASAAIAPNVVHSLDASLLWLVVAMGKKEGINSFALIHDSFGTHVADTNRFFQLIREALIALFSNVDFFSRLDSEFKSQLPEAKHKDLPELPSYGNFNLDNILHARHAFA